LKRVARLLVIVGLGGYALAAPVSVTLSTISLLLAVAGALPLWLTRTPAPYDRSVAIAVTLYLLVKLVTSVTAVDIAQGLREFTRLWPYLLVWVIPLGLRTGPQKDRLLRLFALSTMAVGLYAVWQHFFGVEYWTGTQLPESHGRYPASAFFRNRQTWTGLSLVTTLFFGGLAAGTLRDRRLFLATSIASLLGNMASHIRGALIGFGAGLSVFVLASRRARRVALVVAVLAAVAVALSPGMRVRLAANLARPLNPELTGSRVFIWKTAFAVGASRPLLGVGPGNFSDAYEEHKGRADALHFNHAHSDWIHEWATSGVAGLLSFVFLMAVVARALWRRRREPTGMALGALAAWVGLAAASLVQCHFRDDEVLMIVLFIASLGLLSGGQDTEDNYGGLPA
jgi:O-antigen ligase